MDKIMDKVEAAEFLNMTPRNLNRLMALRLAPFIRVFFSAGRNGMVFFSRKKLEEYEKRSAIEDLEGMTEAQKEAWVYKQKMNILIEQKKETMEEALIVKIAYRSKQFKDMFNSKTSEFSEEERKKLRENSDLFTAHFELIARLHECQKKRLLEFFEDRECVVQRFPDLFKSEIEAQEKAEAEKKKVEADKTVVVEMRNGIKVEHYLTLPGTLKPRKENTQVVQEGSEIFKTTDAYLKKE